MRSMSKRRRLKRCNAEEIDAHTKELQFVYDDVVCKQSNILISKELSFGSEKETVMMFRSLNCICTNTNDKRSAFTWIFGMCSFYGTL